MGVSAHRDRALAAMEADDLDLLLLGRDGNARFVSGANRLTLAGTRPFAPGCVLVRATRAVHLLSITDEGIPADIPTTNLFPITWNPMNMLGAVAAATEGHQVRRIGVDGMSPLFEALLGMTFEGAELVDAESVLREVRRVKTPADLDGMRAAGAVASEAIERALQDGDTRGTGFLAEMARLGVTTPSFTPVVRRAGDRFSVRAGAIRDGWEAVLARHRPVDAALTTAARDAVAACRPGTRVGALRSERTAVEGVGLGHEELSDDDVLEPGMTVIVITSTADAIEHGDTIAVTDAEPEVLTA